MTLKQAMFKNQIKIYISIKEKNEFKYFHILTFHTTRFLSV